MTATFRNNWFWPLAATLLGAVWATTKLTTAPVAAHLELALLFDVLVTLPLLFVFCYAKRLPTRQIVMRIVALQCLGVWLAGKIVPVDAQTLLPHLELFRIAGLVVLALIELRLVVEVLRVVFRANATEAELQAKGMPPILAKLVLLEARFWRWVGSNFRK